MTTQPESKPTDQSGGLAAAAGTKWVLAAIIAAILALIVLPVAVITLVITPTNAANSPEQQLAECDQIMRNAGLLARGASTDDLTSPNAGNNAQIVVAVGERMHVPAQGIIVALATAQTESGLKNYANDGTGSLDASQRPPAVPYPLEASLQLPHDAVGRDHGSLGIMQQQWPWWGTMQELMTPAIAARKFYEALFKVSGWQNMPVTVAAQSVQGSAKPDAYAASEPRARALYAAYRGVGGATDDAEAAAVGLGAAIDPSLTTLPTDGGDGQDLCAILRQGIQQQKAEQANPIIHSSEAGVRAVQAAQSQIGLPYVWGGGGLDGPSGGGFDCSGLTRYAVYQATGKELPRTTYEQIHSGVPVSDLSQMLPGDLVLSNFSSPGVPEHVQLYAGGGQVVEAQTFGVPVKMSPFPHSQVVVRRVL